MYKILLTGASGYIGSCLYFYLNKKYEIFPLDKKKNHNFKVIQCNLNNISKINFILKKKKPNLVIHLAAQSLVDEKINKNKYIINNINATKNLIDAMKKNSINKIIFSSTAAVYKNKNTQIKEKDQLKPMSIYAKTKLLCEKKIHSSGMKSVILRFFNICSSLTKPRVIGEFHNPETHLIPTLVYKNKFKQKIFIYGNNFATYDGTCVRDYIHIKDICSSIYKSIIYLRKNKKNTITTLNIGGKNKLTNLQVLKKVELLTKKKSNFKIVRRRKGDVASLICSIYKAQKVIDWYPNHSNMKKIIEDEIKWTNFLIKNKKKRIFKNYIR